MVVSGLASIITAQQVQQFVWKDIWIEAKLLTTITAQQVQQFVWKDIICRYGVPHTVITHNGRQFIDKELAKFYTGLGIKHITSSVEHPQTNG